MEQFEDDSKKEVVVTPRFNKIAVKHTVKVWPNKVVEEYYTYITFFTFFTDLNQIN